MLKKVIVLMLIAGIVAAPGVQAMNDRAAITARAAQVKAAIIAVQKKQVQDKRKGFFGKLKDRILTLVKKPAVSAAAGVSNGLQRVGAGVDHCLDCAGAAALSAATLLESGVQFAANHKGKIMLTTVAIAAAVAAKYAADYYTREPVFFGPADGLNDDLAGRAYRIFADFCWNYLHCNDAAPRDRIDSLRQLDVCDYKRIYLTFGNPGIGPVNRDNIPAWVYNSCETYLARVRGY